MSQKNKIGFIGAGSMAYGIAGGLVQKTDKETIFVSSRTSNSLQRFENKLGLRQTYTDNAKIIEQCDIIILSVLPNVLPSVLKELRQTYAAKPQKPLLVSVAAGVSSATIGDAIDDKHARIARVMPNTPSQIGEGMSGVYMNENCSDDDKQAVKTIVSTIGKAVFVENEDDIHTVTAVSGSGPGYFYYFIECLIKAGEANGLPHEQARELAIQTARGACMLASVSEESVTEMKEEMMSIKGTTASGIESLMQSNLPEITLKSVNAARDRSIELSKQDS